MRGLVAAGLLLLAGWAGAALGEPEEPTEELGEAPRPTEPEIREPTELSDERWLLVTSRMEGASADISLAAREVQIAAEEIEAAGRLSRLTQLSGLATGLNHRVIQAQMAAEQLIQP